MDWKLSAETSVCQYLNVLVVIPIVKQLNYFVYCYLGFAARLRRKGFVSEGSYEKTGACKRNIVYKQKFEGRIGRS